MNFSQESRGWNLKEERKKEIRKLIIDFRFLAMEVFVVFQDCASPQEQT